MMSTVLLTFIFTFLITHLVRLVHRYVAIPSGIIVLIAYALVIWGLYFGITNYLPKLIEQVMKMTDTVVNFYQLQDTNEILKYVTNYISKSSMVEQFKKGMGDGPRIRDEYLVDDDYLLLLTGTEFLLHDWTKADERIFTALFG